VQSHVEEKAERKRSIVGVTNQNVSPKDISVPILNNRVPHVLEKAEISKSKKLFFMNYS